MPCPLFFAPVKVFEEALNAVKFLGSLKKLGPAQNILGPVKGQGISVPSISREVRRSKLSVANPCKVLRKWCKLSFLIAPSKILIHLPIKLL